MSSVNDYYNSLDPEVRDWYMLSPLQRWHESMKLWEYYISIGGTLDPEPDTQSPFFDPTERTTMPADGRPGLRILRKL